HPKLAERHYSRRQAQDKGRAGNRDWYRETILSSGGTFQSARMGRAGLPERRLWVSGGFKLQFWTTNELRNQRTKELENGFFRTGSRRPPFDDTIRLNLQAPCFAGRCVGENQIRRKRTRQNLSVTR